MNHKKLSAERCVLVCCDKDCKENGAKKLFKELEEAIEKHGLQESVTLHKCECLGLCSRAPNVMAYPGGHWFTEARPRDVKLILDALNE